MKRSEMVEYLISNSKVKLEKPVASYLLRLMEIKGMLPPPSHPNKNCLVSYCWEPEND